MPAVRSRLAVIFLTVFIDIVGFGIVIPILPYYASHFGAKGLEFGARRLGLFFVVFGLTGAIAQGLGVRRSQRARGHPRRRAGVRRNRPHAWPRGNRQGLRCAEGAARVAYGGRAASL